MILKILVPVDGSKQSEKALEYAVKTLSHLDGDFDDNPVNKTPHKVTELIILHVLPQFAVPLGFERPMKSLRTGEVISFSDYIHEFNETFLNEWERNLTDYTKIIRIKKYIDKNQTS